jgi:hypothetical protein
MSPYKVLTRSDINFYLKASPKTNLPTPNVRIESIQKIHSKLYNNLEKQRSIRNLVITRILILKNH